MTTIGNLIILLATLIYFGLLFTVLGKKSGGEDAALGYAWLSVICNLALLFLFVVLSFIIARKGGFAWISPVRSGRKMLVAVGLLAAVCTTLLCGVFSNEKDQMPSLMKLMVTIIPVLIPMVLLLTATILLNDRLRAYVPVAVYKWPLVAVLVVGLSGIVLTIYTYQKELEAEEQHSKEKSSTKSLNQDEHLNPGTNSR